MKYKRKIARIVWVTGRVILPIISFILVLTACVILCLGIWWDNTAMIYLPIPIFLFAAFLWIAHLVVAKIIK